MSGRDVSEIAFGAWQIGCEMFDVGETFAAVYEERIAPHVHQRW